MKKIAVFGKAGGGKSTLARSLAELTGLPLYTVDVIQYRAGGGKVPDDEYRKKHSNIIRREAWIIDGFGCIASAWERFAAADTLIHVDLPLWTHYVWVTKRLVKCLVENPEGWPENSPMWRSTIAGYRVIPICHRLVTPKYRQLVADSASTKRVHHLRSPGEMKTFLEAVMREFAPR